MDISHSLTRKRSKQIKETIYTLSFITIMVVFIGYLTNVMGVTFFFQSVMKTAYSLLIDTALYIMAIAVIMGAFGNLLTEFGVVSLLNFVFAPLMKPLYNLPGAAFLGIATTYLSDNPAIITLAGDEQYIKFFKKEQVPLLCNLGTAFGMGLILTTFMIGLGFFREAMIGNIGAIIGSVVSVRIMTHKIKKSGYFESKKFTRIKMNSISEIDFIKSGINSEDMSVVMKASQSLNDELDDDDDDTFFIRFMTSMLIGGKRGVEMGIAIIPGLIFVCTIIMLITFGPADVALGYQGLAYEGVDLLPRIGALFTPIIQPLFGFTSPEAIAFPITSLGAVGAAMSLVPKFLDLGLIGGNDIAVFTAMGMCWSGYLSTHIGMMDALNHRKLISPALFSHTIGGLVAGISAHLIYVLIAFI